MLDFGTRKVYSKEELHYDGESLSFLMVMSDLRNAIQVRNFNAIITKSTRSTFLLLHLLMNHHSKFDAKS